MVSSPLAHNLKLINEAIHKASRFMQRDFNEIMQLQSSKRSLKDFTSKCYTRLYNKLVEALNEVRPQFDVILANEPKPETKSYFVIEPISGLTNFTRSIPFCSMVIALFNDKEPLAISIHNPIIRETYYAAQNLGAWHENYNETIAPKSRMRVSNLCELDRAIMIRSKNDVLYGQNRILGSSILELAYLASGKVDLIMAESESLLTQAALMMVREAGGFTVQRNNQFLASNEALSKQATALFDKLVEDSNE